jgi:hypothetical protein
MSTLRRACELALALREVTQAEYRGITSFRSEAERAGVSEWAPS